MKANRKRRRGSLHPARWLEAFSGLLGGVSRLPHIGPLVLGAFVAGILTVLAGQVFVLRQVALEGHPGFSPVQVMAWGGLRGGENMLLLNLQDVVRKLEAQRWIANVRIWKVWPSTLRIVVTRAQPFAFVPHRAEWVAVDRGGDVLGKMENPAGPFVYGVSVGAGDRVSGEAWPEVGLLLERYRETVGVEPGEPREIHVGTREISFVGSSNAIRFPLEGAREAFDTFEALYQARRARGLDAYDELTILSGRRVMARRRAQPQVGSTMISTGER
ncbi:MAG: FtsQ-type POTRA domain-containing protein [Nitrospirae bacterium]|nr:FtsQ-type POTRA domain-containing protein [Nitrospirota bacterium]